MFFSSTPTGRKMRPDADVGECGGRGRALVRGGGAVDPVAPGVRDGSGGSVRWRMAAWCTDEEKDDDDPERR